MRQELYRGPRNYTNWLLIICIVFTGLTGGAAGGILAPLAIDGFHFTIPGRHILIAGALGAAIGLLPSLFAGLVAYDISNRASAILLSSLMAIVVFGGSAVLAGFTMGWLYLIGLGAC